MKPATAPVVPPLSLADRLHLEEEEEEEECVLEPYPAVPYYGILHSLDLCLDICTRDTTHTLRCTSSPSFPSLGRVNGRELTEHVNHILCGVQEVVKRHGVWYWCGTAPLSSDGELTEGCAVSRSDERSAASAATTMTAGTASVLGPHGRTKIGGSGSGVASGFTTKAALAFTDPASSGAPWPPATQTAGFTVEDYLVALQTGFGALCTLRDDARRRESEQRLLNTRVRKDTTCHHQDGHDEEKEKGEVNDGRCDGGTLKGAASSNESDVAVHDVLYVRMLAHPVWKDIAALLAVEHGRLVLFMSASSRVTQQRLSDCYANAMGLNSVSTLTHLTGEEHEEQAHSGAAHSGAALAWLAGATLVTEPASLSLTDVNPVYALWDVVVSLPLLSPPPTIPAESPRGSRCRGKDGASRHPPLVTGTSLLLDADTVMRGFHVQVLSSLPLPGAQRGSSIMRLVEETVLSHPSTLFSESVVPSMSDSITLASTYNPLTKDSADHTTPSETAKKVSETLQSCASRPRPCSSPSAPPNSKVRTHPQCCRRYTWRLVSHGSGVGGAVVVLPTLLTHLVHCLVQGCGLLQSFELRFNRGAPTVGGRLGDGGERAHASAVSATGPAAMTYVQIRSGRGGVRGQRSSMPGLLQRGPSTQSWRGFSRLSGPAWIRTSERRRLGLLDVNEADGEEEEVDYEFTVTRIRYTRHPLHQCTLVKQKGAGNVTCVQSSVLLRHAMSPSCKKRRCEADNSEVSGTFTMPPDPLCHGDCGAVRPVEDPASWGPCFELVVSVDRVTGTAEEE